VDLSIIIINYNVAERLDKCLESLQMYLKNISAEVIVMDNASPDRSWISLKEKYPKVQFHPLDKNYGFAVANNKGVALAKGEYILLLNPDTLILDNLFEDLLKFSKQHPEMGTLGVRMINGEGKFLPESKRSVPNLRNSFSKLFLSQNEANKKNYYRGDISEEEIAEVEVITGAFMWMQKKIYEKVGGLDEAYFMYGEDIDICYSLLNLGYKNYYFGKKTIIHYKGESTTKDEVYLNRFYGAMQIFLNKYYKNQNPLQYQILSAGLKLKYKLAKNTLKRKSSS